jgi:hypothetical protein
MHQQEWQAAIYVKAENNGEPAVETLQQLRMRPRSRSDVKKTYEYLNSMPRKHPRLEVKVRIGYLLHVSSDDVSYNENAATMNGHLCVKKKKKSRKIECLRHQKRDFAHDTPMLEKSRKMTSDSQKKKKKNQNDERKVLCFFHSQNPKSTRMKLCL